MEKAEQLNRTNERKEEGENNGREDRRKKNE